MPSPELNETYRPPLFFEQSKALLEQDYDRYQENREVRTSHCVESYKTERDSQEACTGRSRHKALEDILRTLDKRWPRSASQIQFHEEYTKGMLGKIYGEDLIQNIEYLMERYKITELKNYQIITAPRRFGKTTSVAMIVAAFILSQPGRKVVIFSPSRRASTSLLELIKTMVDHVVGDKQRIVVANTERFVVESIWGVVSEVVSLPNNVKISRSFFSLLTFSPNSHFTSPFFYRTISQIGHTHTPTHTHTSRFSQPFLIKTFFRFST